MEKLLGQLILVLQFQKEVLAELLSLVYLRETFKICYHSNMKILLSIAPIFLLLIGCVTNQEAGENSNTSSNQTQVSQAVKKDNSNCRKVKVSGSRLKKEICMTNEEEEAMAEKSQRILRDQQNRERVRQGMPDPG
jgi:hypothetical protein